MVSGFVGAALCPCLGWSVRPTAGDEGAKKVYAAHHAVHCLGWLLTCSLCAAHGDLWQLHSSLPKLQATCAA